MMIKVNKRQINKIMNNQPFVRKTSESLQKYSGKSFSRSFLRLAIRGASTSYLLKSKNLSTVGAMFSSVSCKC